jgi:hypothetical protein
MSEVSTRVVPVSATYLGISANMLFSSLAPILGLTALALAQDTSLETVKKAFDNAGVSLIFYL